MCVIILLYMAGLLAAIGPGSLAALTLYVPSYYYICVIILLYMCHHTTTLLYMCRPTTSEGAYLIGTLILLHLRWPT